MRESSERSFDHRLDEWGGRQVAACPSPDGFIGAVARIRQARRRRRAAIGGVAVVALAAGAWVALSGRGVTPSGGSIPQARVAHGSAERGAAPPARLSARNATAFALMRANEGYARDDVVLPEAAALAWALEDPLGPS